MSTSLNVCNMGVRMRFFSVISLLLFLAHPASSQAQTVALEGFWSGNGYFQPSNGKRESIRCRVSYRKVTNKLYYAAGTCANPSGTINQSVQLTKVSGKRYVGVFSNSEFNISGRARVVLSGNHQTVTLTSQQGTGQMRLRKR